jgi:general secretion pathway protein J
MIRDMHETARDAGFSLIEVLISIVLLALILMSTQTALRFGQRSWELVDDIDHDERDSAAVKFIEHRLVQTTPLYEKETDGRNRIAFRGTQHAVSFIAPSGGGADGGGLYRFELSAEPLPDGHQSLVLHSLLYRPLAAAEVGDRRVLIPEIESFSLRYLGRMKPNEQPMWVANWVRTDVLPELIELRFVARHRRLIKPSILQVELRLRPP